MRKVERNPVGYSALTKDQRQEIVEALRAGATGTSLADQYSVSPAAISYLRKKYLPTGQDVPLDAERRLRQRRFWGRVQIGAANECWPHDSGSLKSYGSCSQSSPAGRLPFVNAFFYANGYLPPRGRVIRHLCNNKSCCNPAHLKEGTKQENARDYQLFLREAQAGDLGPTYVEEPVSPPPGGWVLDLETPLKDLQDAADLERLMRGHRVLETSGCWIYRGKTPNGKRPNVRRGGEVMQPARAVWLIVKGSVPADMWVLHNCPDGLGGNSGNGNCINPEHLYLGTPADNANDTTSHGRRQTGARHRNAKLTNGQVNQMRVLRRDGATLAELADLFGVAEANVARITSDAARYPGAGGPITRRRQGRKLTEAKVSQAREAAAQGRSLSEIAVEFGVNVETMRDAVTGHSWTRCTTPPVKLGSQGLSDAQVRALRETYHRGQATVEELATKYGISPTYTRSLVSGKERREAGGPVTRKQLTSDQHYAIRVGYQSGKTKQELMEEFSASLNQVNDSLAGRTGRNSPGPTLPPASRGGRPRGQRPMP